MTHATDSIEYRMTWLYEAGYLKDHPRGRIVGVKITEVQSQQSGPEVVGEGRFPQLGADRDCPRCGGTVTRNARPEEEVLPPVITFHSCAHARASLPEWAQDPIYEGEPIFMIVAGMEDMAAEQADLEYEADVLDRLRGRCDLCGELPAKREQLAIDGGLALCSGCSTRGDDQ